MSKGPPRRSRPARDRARPGRDRGGDRDRSGKKPGGFDWSVADDEDDDVLEPEADEEERYDEDEGQEHGRRRGRRGRAPAAPRRDTKTLMDLCTPVFGYAAMLPGDPSDAQPAYETFRNQVLGALNRVQAEAAEQGIEAEDARQACYALCFFLDTHVSQSQWTGKARWAGEPLGIVLQQDPEGGVNFFRRLDGFGDRQKAVKEVFLVCLAMGFRGKYAEQDAATQAAQIADVRQKIVRAIHPEPLDKQGELFPEAYRPAAPIADEVPSPPRWWWFASLGLSAFVLLIWIALFVWAGASSGSADEVVVRELERVRDSAPSVPVRPDEPAGGESVGGTPADAGGPAEDGP